MLILGTSLSMPASLLAALAPSIEVLFGARLFGGLAAGMAYPTTLALITALWSGPARTKSIALWSGLGGAIAALGPLLAGALLTEFDWGSVFVITLPLAVVALYLAVRFVPAHVNEATDPGRQPRGHPVGPAGGCARAGHQLRARAERGSPGAGVGGHRPRGGGRLRTPPASGEGAALRPRGSRAPHLLGGRVRGDHRVRHAHGRDVRGPAVPAERARILDAGRRGRDPPGGQSAWCWSRHARRSWWTRTVRVSPCSSAMPSACWASSRCSCSGRRTSPTGRSVLATPSSASASGSPERRPRTRSPAPCPYGAPAWPPGRPICSATWAERSCSRSSARFSPPATRRPSAAAIAGAPNQDKITNQVQTELTKSFSSAVETAERYPQYESQIVAAAKSSFLDGDERAYLAGIVAILLGAALVFFLFPRKEREAELLAQYHSEDVSERAGPATPPASAARAPR